MSKINLSMLDYSRFIAPISAKLLTAVDRDDGRTIAEMCRDGYLHPETVIVETDPDTGRPVLPYMDISMVTLRAMMGFRKNAFFALLNCRNTIDPLEPIELMLKKVIHDPKSEDTVYQFLVDYITYLKSRGLYDRVAFEVLNDDQIMRLLEELIRTDRYEFYELFDPLMQ